MKKRFNLSTVSSFTSLNIHPTPFPHAARAPGHDADETGASFGVTIPLEKAIDPFGDVLLATTMRLGFGAEIRRCRWSGCFVVSGLGTGRGASGSQHAAWL